MDISQPPEQRAAGHRSAMRPVSPTGCLLGVMMIAVGVGAALLDIRLVYAARLYCDAGAEPPHLFVLDLEMLPRLIIGPFLACTVYGVAAILGRVSPIGWTRAGRTVVTLAAVGAGLAAVAAMIVYDVNQLGTLNGYPGDSGLCGPDNVPPWWPTWLSF